MEWGEEMEVGFCSDEVSACCMVLVLVMVVVDSEWEDEREGVSRGVSKGVSKDVSKGVSKGMSVGLEEGDGGGRVDNACTTSAVVCLVNKDQ